MRRLALILLTVIGIVGCLPAHRTTAPDPLEARSFAPPDAHEGTLSNGLRVTVVENHEVPLVWVRIAFERGNWTDPADKPGLAYVTMDMLNEGAGDLDAAEISTAARRLATHMSTWSLSDTSGAYIRSLTKNVGDSLDLLRLILREPTFPEDDWALLQKKRLADLTSARNNPKKMHNRVWLKRFYGDSYKGNIATEAGFKAITTDDMRAWWKSHLTPTTARIFVGGDTTLEAIQPLLEQRFGSWTGEAIAATFPDEVKPNADAQQIVLIDKPGAPQSVVAVGLRARARTDADYMAAYMANMCFGGFFSARLNINLREDKGWTYSARSSFQHNSLPEVFKAGASVKTDTTADTIREILRELSESQGDRPFADDELASVRGYLLGTYPVRFENPNYLLEQLQDVWIYDLPDNWVSGYSDRVRSVKLPDAQAAWSRWIDPGRLTIVVVGDAATIRPGLEGLDLPIVVVDADGTPVGEKE